MLFFSPDPNSLRLEKKKEIISAQLGSPARVLDSELFKHFPSALSGP
jgi:hypothetical protein